MNLVKSTGNGMSLQVANLEIRKRAIQRKDAGDAYRKQAEYFHPKGPSLSDLEDLLLGNKEREPETPEVSAAVREFQQLESTNSRTQNNPDIKGQNTPLQTSKVVEVDLETLLKKRLKEQVIAKYSYQIQLKHHGFIDQQSRFFLSA